MTVPLRHETHHETKHRSPETWLPEHSTIPCGLVSTGSLTRETTISNFFKQFAFVAACEHQPWKLCQGLPKSHLVARGPLINGNAPKFSSSKPKFSYSKISPEILSPPACRHPCETGRNFAHAIHLLGGQFWLRKVISKFYNFKHLHFL